MGRTTNIIAFTEVSYCEITDNDKIHFANNQFCQHNHFNEKERKKGPDNTESEWRMWTLIFNNKNSSRPLDAFKTECGI